MFYRPRVRQNGIVCLESTSGAREKPIVPLGGHSLRENSKRGDDVRIEVMTSGLMGNTGLEPVGSVGLEPTIGPSNVKDLQKTIDQEAGRLPDLGARFGQISPELAAVVAAWPSLPEPVKAGILAMIQATRDSYQQIK